MASKQSEEQKPIPKPVITYTLPFGEREVTHEEVFAICGEDPLFLRPADIKRLYGIPISTVYDWISEQPLTHFPAIKLVVKDEGKRRLVLVPKQLLDQWIIEHSTLMKVKNR